MSNFNQEKVLSIRHWTDRLFRFRTTRNPSLRFLSGQFRMMGLEVEGCPLVRAYSLVSANYAKSRPTMTPPHTAVKLLERR
jgi:ferredoxin--NADP+ reductase